jgi:hypothetical protein
MCALEKMIEVKKVIFIVMDSSEIDCLGRLDYGSYKKLNGVKK